MRRTQVFSAALVAGLALPTLATASPGRDAGGDSSRADRSVGAKPAEVQRGERTPVRVRAHDPEASSRHAATRRTRPAPLLADDPKPSMSGGAGRHAGRLSPFERTFDHDGDGALSEKERAEFVPAFERYVRTLRTPVDRSRDGLIDEREWHAFVKDRFGESAEWHVAHDRRRVEAVRRGHDADGDGTLDEDERTAFAASMDAHRLAELERLDRDADGAVGDQELAFARAARELTVRNETGYRRFIPKGTRRVFGDPRLSAEGTETASNRRGTGTGTATARGRTQRPD